MVDKVGFGPNLYSNYVRTKRKAKTKVFETKSEGVWETDLVKIGEWEWIRISKRKNWKNRQREINNK